MIADRVGHGIALALRAGVVAAHNALQFGEFADHPSDEIGLAQARCAFCGVGKSSNVVIPAKAGTQNLQQMNPCLGRVPAFAGMTEF
jgi:hypothetical protein